MNRDGCNLSVMLRYLCDWIGRLPCCGIQIVKSLSFEHLCQYWLSKPRNVARNWHQRTLFPSQPSQRCRCSSHAKRSRKRYSCPHTVKSQPGTDAEKTKQPLDDGLQHYQLIIRDSTWKHPLNERAMTKKCKETEPADTKASTAPDRDCTATERAEYYAPKPVHEVVSEDCK